MPEFVLPTGPPGFTAYLCFCLSNFVSHYLRDPPPQKKNHHTHTHHWPVFGVRVGIELKRISRSLSGQSWRVMSPKQVLSRLDTVSMATVKPTDAAALLFLLHLPCLSLPLAGRSQGQRLGMAAEI